MRFVANRLVTHLESCNATNWSTIRAEFKPRLTLAQTRVSIQLFQTACYIQTATIIATRPKFKTIVEPIIKQNLRHVNTTLVRGFQ